MLRQADDDVELAVELINTLWVLADPPDRLTDVGVVQSLLRERGEGALAGQLRPPDLGPLRQLRERLRPVFGARSSAEASGVLNPLLREANATPQLVAGPEGASLRVDAGKTGVAALAARLAAGLACHVAAHGVARLGVCGASPCTAVFVDRTRGGTRRYCCDACNDRAAAAAYRRRRRSTR